MLDFSVKITLNDKGDLEILKNVLIKQNIGRPIYIVELVDYFQIEFTSEYQINEIEKDILSYYPNYGFIDTIRGGESIKMSITSTQSPMSTNSWGRVFNSDFIVTKKYLVEETIEQDIDHVPPNPTIKVIFGNQEKEYNINIVPGIHRITNQEGFIVLKNTTL